MSNDLSNAFGYRKFIEKQGAERPGHAWIKRTPRPGGGYNYEYPDGAGKPVTPQHQADYHHGQMEAHEKRAIEHRIARSQLPRGEARQSFHAAIKAHRQAAKLHGEAYSAHRKGSGGAEASHRAEVASDHAHGAAENHAKQSLATHRKGEGLLSRLGHKLVDIPRHVVEHPEGSHSRIAERLAGAFNRSLEKGAPAKVGESRNWGGIKYTKQSDGNWVPQHEAGKAPSAADLKANHGKVHYYPDHGAFVQQHDGSLRPLSGFNPQPPRGKKADHSGMTHYVDDVIDFSVGGHPELEEVDDDHRVGIHFDPKNPGKKIIVTNHYGEDITHHVPEQAMQRLTPKYLQAEHDAEERRIDERDRAEARVGPDDDRDDNDDNGDDGDDDYERGLTSALTFFQFVEKGKAAKPGESRNWGGQQYTKQPDGSWKPKESVARNVGAAWGQLGPLNPKAAGPRGKKINPADLHPTFMEHEMDFGKKGKHNVRLHYDVNPGERPDTQSPGYEPFVEDLKIVNRHGEDIGHHVPEAERKKLEGHVLQSWAGGLAEQGTAERQRSILDLKIPVEEITTGPNADNGGTPESAEEGAGTPASAFKALESVINYKNFTEKGKAAQPGETRNWGGTDYTKQPDGTWKPKGAATHEQGVAFGPHSTSGPTPRGDKADTSGWDGSMDDTLDFNWGKGDANEHDVTVHYVLHREEGAGRHYPGAPAYAEVMVTNEHGEDVTDHIPEKHIRELEERAMQHVNR